MYLRTTSLALLLVLSLSSSPPPPPPLPLPPLVSVQVWGGLLVSGSCEGKLIVWSMRTQKPTVNSEQLVHSASLSNIHVLDNSVIITVGRGSSVLKENEATTVVPSKEPNAPLATISSVSNASNGLLNVMSQEVVSTAHSPCVEKMAQDLAQLIVGGETSSVPRRSEDTVTLWQYGVPLRPTKMESDLGEIATSAFHLAHTGNMFLAVGLCNGTVKILNLPNFSIASELHFPEMAGRSCLHVALNLSRESPVQNHNYYRNPFRDLILTTAWSDGKVMICQVLRQ